MLDMNRRQLMWAGGGALGAFSTGNPMILPRPPRRTRRR